jgi:hypothetical protein
MKHVTDSKYERTTTLLLETLVIFLLLAKDEQSVTVPLGVSPFFIITPGTE